jgi:hypothetical protein
MKSCNYCGRANDDEQTHCHECGTSFLPPPEVEPPVLPGFAWADHITQYGGLALVGLLAYFMSFGPISKYAGPSALPRARALGTTAPVGAYPKWIVMFYSPAFYLEGILPPYAEYVQWWEKS